MCCSVSEAVERRFDFTGGAADAIAVCRARVPVEPIDQPSDVGALANVVFGRMSSTESGKSEVSDALPWVEPDRAFQGAANSETASKEVS